MFITCVYHDHVNTTESWCVLCATRTQNNAVYHCENLTMMCISEVKHFMTYIIQYFYFLLTMDSRCANLLSIYPYKIQLFFCNIIGSWRSVINQTSESWVPICCKCNVIIFMVAPCINNITLYYPTNALNYINCRLLKTH